jgi:hypothetical protein
MAEWRVNLQGDELDLEELAARLTSPVTRIRREEGRYFLTADRLNNLGGAREVRAAAENILQSLNGFARLKLNAQTPLSAGNIERVEDDGLTHRFLTAESLTFRIREGACVALTGGAETSEPVQQVDPLNALCSLADTDETVARVMSMYGKARGPWKDLYPIYEIIESSVGGEDPLVSKEWTSRNQISRFTRTAGHPKVAGDEARHGVSTAEPPPNPMTPAEGWAFIELLVSQWLEFKQQSQQTP